VQQLVLFVDNEASAIQWLRQELKEKSQTFQEIHTEFTKHLTNWDKREAQIELKELLEQNFLCYDGKGEVPNQIHSYLSSNFKELRNLEKTDRALIDKAKNRWYVPDPNKLGDLEKMREKTLINEFFTYLPAGYTPDLSNYKQQPAAKALKADRVAGSARRLKVCRSEALRAGFRFCWENNDYQTILAVAGRVVDDIIQEDEKLLMYYDQAQMMVEGR